MNAAFVLSSFSPGADHYRVCRSNDTTGWGGCSHVMDHDTGANFTVMGDDLPANGFRRAYRFSACDAGNSCTRWADNPETYVYFDDQGPTAPGPTTVDCPFQTTGPTECWVTGNFVISVTPASDSGSGVESYKICRSNDSTGGSAGCQFTLSQSGGTSFTISGSNLPSRGFRRSYLFRARDQLGNTGNWNSRRYVRVDRDDPTVSADNASNDWFTNRTLTLSAADETGGVVANSGLQSVRYRWNLSLNGACTTGTPTTNGATLTVPEGDNHLYLCAKDNTGRVGFWDGGPYRVDSAAPIQNSLTISNQLWVIDDNSTYAFTAKATDTGSGVRELRALINRQGGNSANPRGFFSWRDASLGYKWSADRVPCSGGGLASKHPTSSNPSTITLVGCSASLSGGQRTVTFTVRPNASFGEFGAINDISLRAWDFAVNAGPWTNYNLNFESRFAGNCPSLRIGQFFGYSSRNGDVELEDSKRNGIGVNLAFLNYRDEAREGPNWRQVPTAEILRDYRRRGALAVVALEEVLFAFQEDAHSPCSHGRSFRLRSDWESRLEQFVSLHGEELRPEEVSLILLQSALNDRCAVLDEVVQAAQAVKRHFPTLALGMAYGATYGADGERLSQPPPATFPDIFDGIGLFSYHLYDVNRPQEKRNATATFYNPAQPEDAATVYGDLLSKLKAHQRVHLFFDSSFNPTHETLGWKEEDLGRIALNYAQFLARRPEAIALVASLDTAGVELPRLLEPVADAHRFLGASLVCPGNDFERDVIESLFVGSGPLSPVGAPACPWTGLWSGFPRGTQVTVLVSTTVSADKRNAIEQALALVPVATDGHITTVFQLTGDPNPIPGPNQVTSTTHPTPSTEGCQSDIGCTIPTFAAPGVLISSRAVQPASQTLQAYVHDVVGHGVLGMCHIDGNLIGGAINSLMSGGQGVFSDDIASEPTALDLAAAMAVYSSGLQLGDQRDAFVAQGLVNP